MLLADVGGRAVSWPVGGKPHKGDNGILVTIPQPNEEANEQRGGDADGEPQFQADATTVNDRAPHYEQMHDLLLALRHEFDGGGGELAKRWRGWFPGSDLRAAACRFDVRFHT